MATESLNGRIEPLSSENYATWAVRVKALLTIKDLADTLTEDPVDLKRSAKALSFILTYCTDQHLSQLNTYTTAKEAWEYLQSTYKSTTGARRLQLRRELSLVKLQAGESITQYVSRVRALGRQIIAAGAPLQWIEVTWAVMAGLPSEYEVVLAVALAGEGDPDLDQLFPKLLEAEQRNRAAQQERKRCRACCAMVKTVLTSQ